METKSQTTHYFLFQNSVELWIIPRLVAWRQRRRLLEQDKTLQWRQNYKSYRSIRDWAWGSSWPTYFPHTNVGHLRLWQNSPHYSIDFSIFVVVRYWVPTEVRANGGLVTSSPNQEKSTPNWAGKDCPVTLGGFPERPTTAGWLQFHSTGSMSDKQLCIKSEFMPIFN